MPQIRLRTFELGAAIPVATTGGRQLIPRLQFMCLVQLPSTFFPREGIIDTGSPYSWFPENVWSKLQPGVDFEELPFETGFVPPRVRTAGWTFTFRLARMLQPIVLLDTSTELERKDVIVQFADGNPPRPLGSKSPPRVVLGLWGRVLEGTNLRMSTDATTGHTLGMLEW